VTPIRWRVFSSIRAAKVALRNPTTWKISSGDLRWSESGSPRYSRSADERDRQLRPIEICPKKGYISLRRKKQFAMIGPVTKTRLEGWAKHERRAGHAALMAMPAGGMCQYKVNVSNASEVDSELVG